MAEISTPDSRDLAEQITRVFRAMDESQKFVAEQTKLMAEAAELERDRARAPWQIGPARMAVEAAFVTRLGP